MAARFLKEAMSNLRPDETGVEGAVVWVSAGEFAGSEGQRGPRVKVVPGTNITSDGLGTAVSITIADPPRELGLLPAKIRNQALRFVAMNREMLLRYWRNEISTREMLDGLTKL